MHSIPGVSMIRAVELFLNGTIEEYAKNGDTKEHASNLSDEMIAAFEANDKEQSCVAESFAAKLKTKYLVWWQRYGPEDDTCEPGASLKDCQHLIDAFENEGVKAFWDGSHARGYGFVLMKR